MTIFRRTVWYRCQACARALAVYERWATTQVDEAFLAALPHDVGRVALATRFGVSAPAVGDTDSSDDGSLSMADHAEVGAYLLGLWGFSDSIVEAIAFHNAPSRVSEPVGLTAVVHAADFLVSRSDPAHAEPERPMLEEGFLDLPEVSARWKGWTALWPGPSVGGPEVKA